MKILDIRKAGLAAAAALIAFGVGLMTGPSPASALVISSDSVLVQDGDINKTFSFSLTQTASELFMMICDGNCGGATESPRSARMSFCAQPVAHYPLSAK